MATTETEGKAKLIRKIFSPAKVDAAKTKDVLSKMENGNEEEEVVDEIELQSFGGRGGEVSKKGSLKEENVSGKGDDPTEMKTKGLALKKKKPWKCRFCNKRFLSKNILKFHSQKRHPFKTLDGTIFRSGDVGEERGREKEGKNNVSMLFDTRRINAEETGMNTQDSHVVGVFEEVDHDDEETDPYEDDSGLLVRLPPEMDKDKAGAQKEVDDQKLREDDEEMAALQKAQALKILTNRAREDKKKQLRKILKSKKAKRRTKLFASEEIGPTTTSNDIETGEQKLPNVATREPLNDPQQEREAIAETSPDLNERMSVEAETVYRKGGLLNTGEVTQVKPNSIIMSFHAETDNIEAAVECRESEENKNLEKTEKEKTLSDTASKDLVPESHEFGNEETEEGGQMGKSSSNLISRCLLMVEGSTVDLTKEGGCATNKAEWQADVEQGNVKNGENNTKFCFNTAPVKVSSAEPVGAQIEEKESDDKAEVYKECNIGSAEIDVVSDNKR